MPKWIHDRAKHIQEKNPDMDESTSFAIATQQAYKLGKTPKGYGTPEGKRTAKAKYTNPKKDYTMKAAELHKEAVGRLNLKQLLTNPLVSPVAQAKTITKTTLTPAQIGGAKDPIDVPDITPEKTAQIRRKLLSQLLGS